jgi:hypothetical protein
MFARRPALTTYELPHGFTFVPGDGTRSASPLGQLTGTRSPTAHSRDARRRTTDQGGSPDGFSGARSWSPRTRW